MNSIRVQGGVALQGKVCIQGSKNAVLPILAATLLTKETTYIRNCPRITDVHRMICLLQCLGSVVKWTEEGVLVNTDKVCNGEMPVEAITGMRSSLCLLGTLLGRCGEITMEYPGGCVIGARPIDMHINALEQMGVSFREAEGKLHAVAQSLHGAEICFAKSSVGATENVILAAVSAEGDTIIHGAAEEPEVEALCRYLVCCGADIEGIGTACLQIHGGRTLYGTEYKVPADRIVAGTYLFGCLGCGGQVLLADAPCAHMQSVIETAEQMGAVCFETEEGLYVQASGRPKAMPGLVTDVYPGFPTDLQSMALTVLTKAEGESIVEERIFENRFRIVEPLRCMGAEIQTIHPNCVKIEGVPRLLPVHTRAQELRGGAALVLAGMMADGVTQIDGCSYIERGYENICRDLRELGARIVSV